MPKTRKAFQIDVEAIIPVLKQLDDGKLSDDEWRRIFDPAMQDEDGSYGFLVEDEGRVVGYLGYAFSERIIRGEVRRFCNLHCWIVEEKYRARSLGLLMPALRMKNVTLTDFTPTGDVLEMCKKLGFETFDTSQRIVPSIPIGLKMFSFKARIIRGLDNVLPYCDETTAKMVRDHNLEYHRHVTIEETDGKKCHIILNRCYKKVGAFELSFLRAHYISDPYILSNNLALFLNRIAIPEGVCGLIVSKFLMKGVDLPYSFKRPGPCMTGAFKPAVGVKTSDLDCLYSEMLKLNF